MHWKSIQCYVNWRKLYAAFNLAAVIMALASLICAADTSCSAQVSVSPVQLVEPAVLFHHSIRDIPNLVALLADTEQRGDMAADALLDFNDAQLRRYSGPSLENQLVERLQREGGATTSTMILLTSFPRRAKTIQLLQGLREKRKGQLTRRTYETSGDITVVTDVVLAHFGDVPATDRTKQQLKEGSAGNILTDPRQLESSR